MQLTSHAAVAGCCSSDGTPSLGTPIRHRCGPKKKKKKRSGFKEQISGVSVVAQQDKNPTQCLQGYRFDPSPSLSGLRIQRWHKLWHRLKMWFRSTVAVTVS